MSFRTDLKKTRKITIFVFIGTLSCLFLYSKILKPQKPIQNSLIKSLEEVDLLQGIRWYSHNSIGSLNIPSSEKCTISELETCPIFKSSVQKQTIENALRTSLKDKTLWPFIWHPGNKAPDSVFSFSVYTIEPQKIHAVKKSPSPLGDLIETLPSFKRVDLSPVLTELLKTHEEIIELKEIEKLKQNIETDYQHVVYLKKHPMGYYLEVPMLPAPILSNSNH